MTEMNAKRIKCPKCGIDFKIIYYSSINTQMNPDLLQELLDGELYYFKCKNCGQSIHLDTWVFVNTSKGAVSVSSAENLEVLREKFKKMGIIKNGKVADYLSYVTKFKGGLPKKKDKKTDSGN